MKIKGTYSDVIFTEESNKKLDGILEYLGLTKDFNDDYHCTLVYSKKYLPFLKTHKGDKQDKTNNVKTPVIGKIAKIKKFGHFDTEDGKNLHVVLDCDFCHKRFNNAKASGATYDYDEYIAHITLMYDCQKDIKNFDISQYDVDEFIGETLAIKEERISPLNLDCVKDKKI